MRTDAWQFFPLQGWVFPHVPDSLTAIARDYEVPAVSVLMLGSRHIPVRLPYSILKHTRYTHTDTQTHTRCTLTALWCQSLKQTTVAQVFCCPEVSSARFAPGLRDKMLKYVEQSPDGDNTLRAQVRLASHPCRRFLFLIFTSNTTWRDSLTSYLT